MKLLITCGGTAGHVFPALAVAQTAKRKGFDIFFIGGERFEKRIIPQYNFRFIELKVSRKNPLIMFGSIIQAVKILKKEACDAVLASGGYVTFPVLVAALYLRRPIYLQEQNALPGRLNKLFSRFAKRVFISFEESEQFFGEKSFLTGNPVREELENLAKKIEPKIPIKRILVFGGSLGSKSLNELAQKMEKSTGYQIIHIKEYIDDIASQYKNVDFVICRAGATSIAEILVLGIPALLIPYPLAKDDHQTVNAQSIVNRGLGFMLLDKELTVSAVEEIVNDDNKIGNVRRRLKEYQEMHDEKNVCANILTEIRRY